MTGPRDMKPWEVRLYATYRNNLHNIKPTTKQGRNIHRLERAFFALPARLYVYWHHYRAQRKQVLTSNTTLKELE